MGHFAVTPLGTAVMTERLTIGPKPRRVHRSLGPAVAADDDLGIPMAQDDGLLQAIDDGKHLIGLGVE